MLAVGVLEQRIGKLGGGGKDQRSQQR